MQQLDQRRHGARGRARRSTEWIAAWRTVSSGSAERRRGPARGPRRRRSGVAAQTAFRRASAERPARATSSSAGSAASPRSAERCDRPAGGPPAAGRRAARPARRASCVVPVELQPARVVDLRRVLAADAVDRRRARRACRAATSGSRACTSRRCRPRAGCRRRPRARRSGGSRGCRETRKSSSCVVKVAPLGRQDVPGDLLQVEAGRRTGCRGTPGRRRPTRSGQAARGGGAEVRRAPASRRGRSAGGSSIDVVDLAVDAAVDRVDQAVALAAAGVLEERAS